MNFHREGFDFVIPAIIIGDLGSLCTVMNAIDICAVHSNVHNSGLAFKIIVLLGVGQPQIKFFSTS